MILIFQLIFNSSIFSLDNSPRATNKEWQKMFRPDSRIFLAIDMAKNLFYVLTLYHIIVLSSAEPDLSPL